MEALALFLISLSFIILGGGAAIALIALLDKVASKLFNRRK